MGYDIEPRHIEPRPTATIRTTLDTTSSAAIGEALGRILPRVAEYVASSGVEPAGPPFARYHDFREGHVDMEAGIGLSARVEGDGTVLPGELPGGPAVVTWHVGPYTGLSDAYRAIEDWMATEDVEAAGPPWEVYWTDPEEEPDSSRWRTEVIWPIR